MGQSYDDAVKGKTKTKYCTMCGVLQNELKIFISVAPEWAFAGVSPETKCQTTSYSIQLVT